MPIDQIPKLALYRGTTVYIYIYIYIYIYWHGRDRRHTNTHLQITLKCNMGQNQHIFMIHTSISAHRHDGVSNYFNVNRLEYLGRGWWGPRSTDPIGTTMWPCMLVIKSRELSPHAPILACCHMRGRGYQDPRLRNSRTDNWFGIQRMRAKCLALSGASACALTEWSNI